MQDRPRLDNPQINRDLTRSMTQTPLSWWVGIIVMGALVGWFLVALAWLVYAGVGVFGLNRPVMWAVLITNFVFFVGISHAGTMISSILRLTQAEWRRPVTRISEIMTVFALAVSSLFPLIHTGRPWRAVFWIFPYDFNRDVWPNVRSPLIWDPSAIFTYLTGSALFAYTSMIPDLAIARDRSTGWRHSFYSVLALGWQGTTRQWRLQAISGFLLSALILPVFVSVHSIVSWDFAVSIVPGWHSTIFAPYFVIGAVHSGVAAVVSLMVVMRWMFKLKTYIRDEHFDAIGRVQFVIATGWMYFFFLDFASSIISNDPDELAVIHRRVFEWPWNAILAITLIAGYVIPAPLLLMKRFRRNIPVMLAISILINIALWCERFWLVVPPLERKYGLTFDWQWYRPTWPEVGITAGAFGIVLFALLVFAKLFPIISIWEEKEGQVMTEEIDVGNARVPAIIRE